MSLLLVFPFPPPPAPPPLLFLPPCRPPPPPQTARPRRPPSPTPASTTDASTPTGTSLRPTSPTPGRRHTNREPMLTPSAGSSSPPHAPPSPGAHSTKFQCATLRCVCCSLPPPPSPLLMLMLMPCRSLPCGSYPAERALQCAEQLTSRAQSSRRNSRQHRGMFIRSQSQTSSETSTDAFLKCLARLTASVSIAHLSSTFLASTMSSLTPATASVH